MIPESFINTNIIDTCAIWNLLSSETLFHRSRACKHTYITTPTVLYECLIKPRTPPITQAKETLRSRLQAHLRTGELTELKISIDDLHEVSQLSSRLGQGELSCAAAARKIHQAVMTDNRRDFRAIESLIDGRLQTTPRLLGWLVLNNHLGDTEVQTVISEHKELEGSLHGVYLIAYHEALEIRLKRQT
ncbi:hypothetical protein [Myxococcus eversor]|uniref:hypothetical protein n=1 Tax=Myxococcus eversor TaxID=2709661 RepID=UPI0013D1782D|nr:hypothetical protein [Myxococcus eversor]